MTGTLNLRWKNAQAMVLLGGLALILALAPNWTFAARPDSSTYVRGMSMTEISDHIYDASLDSTSRTEAQEAVDALYNLGVRHLNLSPRATMDDPRSSELTPMTPADQRSAERLRYSRLIDYIHGKGMTVGLRPIFFVVGPDGKIPYVETRPDGSQKIWWHGNIQPEDPDHWFESFKTYLDIYLNIASDKKIEEFTIGAELNSMTVGFDGQWKEYPYGFPAQWLDLLRYVKSRLGPGTRVMYDIDFTDERVSNSGVERFGGEFERWRYRLVDLANPHDPEQARIWKEVVSFWNELDAIGIDFYRSLATRKERLPENYEALVVRLRRTSDRYASQLDNALYQIQEATDLRKEIIFKEVGFRSVTRGFVEPFIYAGKGQLNIAHQAAAYDAIFRSFWAAGWDWFKGVTFWDTSVDPHSHGPLDKGFSPVGKDATEQVIRRYFQ